MTKVKVITGYVPLAGHPRSPETYGALGEKFRGVTAAPVKAYYNQLHQCWMQAFIEQLPLRPTHSEGDNPKKNSLGYHVVNHQKVEWLLCESLKDPDTDVFIWMDYGIFHQPGINAEVVNKFLSQVQPDDLAIPGCWNPGIVYDDFPCWRFCGSMMIVPRPHLHALDSAIKEQAKRRIYKTNNVTWEVNTWARVEQKSKLPIRWYSADHNHTMFTNYGLSHDVPAV